MLCPKISKYRRSSSRAQLSIAPLFSICTSSLIRYCGRVLQKTGTALVNCISYTRCIKIELNPLAAIVPVLVVVKKCNVLLAFLIRSSTFHFKLSLIVSPSSFVLLTTSGSFPERNLHETLRGYVQTKSWALYICPAGLKCLLFSGDQSITWSVIRWALQTSPLWTISEAVYHQQMSITMANEK